jgi:peptide/nickel transport system substrate-binding protein
VTLILPAALTRRSALQLSAGALLALTTKAQAQGKKVVRFAPHAALRVLDPVTTPAYVTRNHGYMVYDTLFAIGNDYRPKPQMVSEWSLSPDKLTHTFVLRDKLAFHDGAPVTSEDCIASIARWAKRDVVGLRLASVIESMSAVDPRTFKIVLKEPFGPILDALAKPSSVPLFIMPKRMADAPPEKALSDVIGSGPFKFVAAEFRPGVSWAYERNESYLPRDEPPNGLAGGKIVHLDRVESIWFPDKQTAINALSKGEIDAIENINADLRPQLAGNKDITVRRKSGPTTSTVRFNWSQPPFNNERIRQAVQQVVTQRDYMEATIGDPNSYQICPALFGCGTPLEFDAGSVDRGKPDVAKAKALLKEGGYGGEKIVIITPGDIASFQALAPLTQQALRSIDMPSEIQSIEWSTFLTRRNSQAPVADGGWNLAHGVFDRMDLVSPLGNPNFDVRGPKGYTGFVDDAQVEALKAEYQHATGLDEQRSIAMKMQQRAYERVFYIPLGVYFDDDAFRSNIKNAVEAQIMVFWGMDKA